MSVFPSAPSHEPATRSPGSAPVKEESSAGSATAVIANLLRSLPVDAKVYISFKYLLLKVEFLQLFPHRLESVISHLFHITILKKAFIKSRKGRPLPFKAGKSDFFTVTVQHEVSYWCRGDGFVTTIP